MRLTESENIVIKTAYNLLIERLPLHMIDTLTFKLNTYLLTQEQNYVDLSNKKS